MRKNVVITGIVIMIIGIVLIGTGVYLIEQGAGINNSSELNLGNGAYAIAPIYVNSTNGIIVVTSHADNIYLIPYSDFSNSITQSTAKTDAISPNSNSTSSVITSVSYTSLSVGKYAAVSFSSGDPSMILVSSSLNGLVTDGLLTLVGGLMFIVAIVVIIYGLLKKNKPPIIDGDIPY